jgi:hypothetical protein
VPVLIWVCSAADFFFESSCRIREKRAKPPLLRNALPFNHLTEAIASELPFRRDAKKHIWPRCCVSQRDAYNFSPSREKSQLQGIWPRKMPNKAKNQSGSKYENKTWLIVVLIFCIYPNHCFCLFVFLFDLLFV